MKYSILLSLISLLLPTLITASPVPEAAPGETCWGGPEAGCVTYPDGSKPTGVVPSGPAQSGQSTGPTGPTESGESTGPTWDTEWSADGHGSSKTPWSDVTWKE